MPETVAGPLDHLPSPYAVALALPEGSVLASNAAAWLRRVSEHPDFDLLRPHGRENLQRLVWLLARGVHSKSRTVMPQWPHLQADAGLTEATVGRWLRWLKERGLLAVVVTGSTPATRGRARVLDDDRNDAAVYAVCVPTRPAYGLPEPVPVQEAAAELGRLDPPDAPVDKSDRPLALALCSAKSFSQDGRDAHTHVRGNECAAPQTPALRAVASDAEPSKSATTGGAGQLSASSTPTPWPWHAAARTGRDRLALCERLQADDPVFRAVGSAKLLQSQSLLRPFLDAGWTPAGFVHGANYRPFDGGMWPYAYAGPDELRNPAGWLVTRLRAWTDETGAPLPCPRPDPSWTAPGAGDAGGPVLELVPALEVAPVLEVARSSAAGAWAAALERNADVAAAATAHVRHAQLGLTSAVAGIESRRSTAAAATVEPERSAGVLAARAALASVGGTPVASSAARTTRAPLRVRLACYVRPTSTGDVGPE